jgi:hypothetical protein
MSVKTTSQSQIGQDTAKNSQIVTSSVITTVSGGGTTAAAGPTGPVITSIVVTNNAFANNSNTISYSNSFVKVFGTGFLANTVVYVNANTIPSTNVTYVSPTELRVALPILDNVSTINFNVVNLNLGLASPTFANTGTPSYPGTYLIVGGGGAGGFRNGGGGGGGGFLSSTFNFRSGYSYPITVGRGGYHVNSPSVPSLGRGSSGNTSSFHSFTAYGGGGGGTSLCRGSNNFCGAFGLPIRQACGLVNGDSTSILPIVRPILAGSGGGGAGAMPSNPLALGGLAFGSAALCTPGTQGSPGKQATGSGGGGGGAGALAPPGCARKGNCGKLFPYTGLFYAGGGGGGFSFTSIPGIPGGAGGSGGGGNGGGPGCNTGAGSPGLGGGGGGGAYLCSCSSRNWGQPGGPGIVILVVPTAAYPGTTPGGATVSTPASAPGMTVLTYPAPAACSPSPQSTYTFIA